MDKHQLFNEFYKKNKDKIYRLCQIMVHDVSQTEDLFQETLINIWKGIDNFKGKSNIDTWAYRIIVNTSINLNLKNKKHKERIEYVQKLNEKQKGKETINDILIEKISLLKSADRIIIGLYLEGYQYKEIAEILGITSSNVGVRINRIKNELKLLSNKN